MAMLPTFLLGLKAHTCNFSFTSPHHPWDFLIDERGEVWWKVTHPHVLGSVDRVTKRSRTREVWLGISVLCSPGPWLSQGQSNQWPAVKNTPMKDKIEHVVLLVSLELYNLALGWICVNLTMYTNESSCGKNNLRKHNSTLPPMLGVQLDADHNLPFCPFWSHAGVAFDNGLLFTEGQAWHSAAWQRIVAKLYQGHNSSGWAVTETPFWSLLLLGV